MRHNKKRNTAFLYETLVKELTKSVVKKQHQRKERVIQIIKENFNKNTPLHRELQLCNTDQVQFRNKIIPSGSAAVATPPKITSKKYRPYGFCR